MPKDKEPKLGDVIVTHGCSAIIIGIFNDEYQILWLKTLEADSVDKETYEVQWEQTPYCFPDFMKTIELLREKVGELNV